MVAKCHVVGCTKPTCAKGLCNTHYMRQRRNGTQETKRAEDWGRRRSHAAYTGWQNLVRSHRQEIPESWLDFWTFVADVPERPEGRVSIFRQRPNEPWSADNFFWRQSRVSAEKRANSAEYMREWQQKMRAANPRYGKAQFLKRAYGVSLEWYESQRVVQRNVCAICKQPETAMIKGRELELAVDHCHDKGHVRGLLCMACNRGLGFFKHDTDLLRSAITYLDSDIGDLL